MVQRASFWISAETAATPPRWSAADCPQWITDGRYHSLRQAAGAGVDFSSVLALITGATRPQSIAAGIAINLLRGGARVVVAGRRRSDEMAAIAGALVAQAGAGSACGASCDQADPASISALFAWADDAGLRFTHLVPFAASNDPRPLIRQRPEDFLRVFSLNSFGVFQLCLRHARSRPSGPWQVVLPLSANHGQLRGSGLYPASKATLRALLVQAQHEIGRRHQGAYLGVALPWTSSSMMAGLSDLEQAAVAAGIRVCRPAESAALCTLLALPQAHELAGTVLDADGGFASADAAAFDALLQRRPRPDRPSDTKS